MAPPRLGISLTDLIPGAQKLPGEITKFLGNLRIDGHSTTTSGGAFTHYGTVVPIGTAFDLSLRDWPLEIPLLSSGLRFRLVLRRAAGSPETLSGFLLDLFLDEFRIKLPGVTPARRIEPNSGSAKPTHLEPDPAFKDVLLIGGGVLRIELPEGGSAKVRLIDTPDPFDPDAPTGPLAAVTCVPPHMLLSSSGFGLTIDRVVFDFSESASPPEVRARNQGDEWTGLYLREAALYLPTDTPAVGPLSLRVRDALFGMPMGMQFDAQLEWGQIGTSGDRRRCGLALSYIQSRASGSQALTEEAGGIVKFTPDPGSSPPNRAAVLARFSQPKAENNESPVIGVRVSATLVENGRERTIGETLQFSSGAAQYKFEVTNGTQLRINAQLGADANAKESAAELPEVLLIFQESGAQTATPGGSSLTPALLQFAPGGLGTDVSGPASELAKISVSLPNDEDVVWRWGEGHSAQISKESPLSLSKLPAGIHTLSGTGKKLTGRARVRVTADGELTLLGRSDGQVVKLAGTGAHTLRSVIARNDLKTFLTDGRRVPPAAPGNVEVEGGSLKIPGGTLAEVEVDLGSSTAASPTPAPPTPPASGTSAGPEVLSRAKVQFDFDQSKAVGWVQGDGLPSKERGQAIASSGTFEGQLRAWLTQTPVPTAVYIVGRTDDASWDKALPDNNKSNDKLGKERADAAAKLVRDVLPDVTIQAQSEQQTTFSGAPAEVDNSGQRLIIAQKGGWHDEDAKPVWATDLRPATPYKSNAEYVVGVGQDARRRPYRCAEIWLVGNKAASTDTTPPPTEPTASKPPAASSRPVLVPGDLKPNEITPTPLPKPPEDKRDSLMRLRGVWDSPVVTSPKDAVPTLAEVVVMWQPATKPGTPDKGELVLNRDGTEPVKLDIGRKVWQLTTRLALDVRVGNVQVSFALDIPDSAVTLNDPAVAAALALGPVLASRLPSVGGLVALPALLGLGYLLKGTGVLQNGGLMLHRAAFDYTDRGAKTVRLACDYSVGLDVDVKLFGEGDGEVRIQGKGLRLRFNGVHLEIDQDKGASSGARLGFDSASTSVAQAGTWKLTGPAGDLLRVTAARAGAGSTWVDLDLAFAMDLGVIKLQGATLRITLSETDGPSAELRGLDLTVNVPKVLTGNGRLKVEQGGALRGGLDITVLPAKLSAGGALSLYTDPAGFTFAMLEVGVKFATAIPLASTGLGLFGFKGRFVANGARALPSQTDPVERELAWFALKPENKYAAKQGQYAVGLGVVVGTLHDGGITFNAEGMLAVGFPEISIVLGVEAHFITPSKDVTEEGEDTKSAKTRIVGLIAIDKDGVVLGIRGSYVIEKVIDIQIPISGYFPFSSGDTRKPGYLRIGSDGHLDRVGQPVSVTLLPDLLKVKAWAFFMIEEGGIKELGKSSLSFDGFAIGLGAGFEIKWEAGPIISLQASASVLIGIGTKPLAFGGQITVSGRLRLLFIVFGLEGQVTFYVSDQSWFKAHFCAEISFFFFSVKACISFDGGGPKAVIPEPNPGPLTDVILMDHRGAILGTSSTPVNRWEKPTPIVWPDAVPVLRFRNPVLDNRTQSPFRAASPQADLTDDSLLFIGPDSLRYAFRLESVTLIRVDPANLVELPSEPIFAGMAPGAVTDAPASWWMRTERPGVITKPDDPKPSPLEGRELGLLWWHPLPVARAIKPSAPVEESPAGAGPLGALLRPPKIAALANDPEDPLKAMLKATLAAACIPAPDPEPAFARGRDAVFTPHNQVILKPRQRSGGSFPSWFELRGGRPFFVDSETTTALLMAAGAVIQPGAIVQLSASVPAGAEQLQAVMTLDHLQWYGADLCTAAFVATATPAIESPKLWLATLPPATPKNKLGPVELGIPLGRLRTAHFGCAHPGPHKRVKSAGAVIATLDSGVPYQVGDDERIGRCAFFGDGRGRAMRMQARFPVAVRNVVIDLLVDGPPGSSAYLVLGLFGSGQTRTETRSLAAGRHRIALADRDLVRIEVLVRGLPWRLRAIEFRVPPFTPTDAAICSAFALPRSGLSTALPIVQGRRAAGTAWEAWSVETQASVNGIAVLMAKAPAAGPWAALRVLPWRGGRLGVLGVSAISADARQKQKDDQAARDAIRNTIKDAPKLTEDAATPVPRLLLVPDAMYKLTIRWSWNALAKGEKQKGWSPQPKEEAFLFRTAKQQPPPQPKPALPGALQKHFLEWTQGAGSDSSNSEFDPRGISRYVLGWEPRPDGPPHFTGDPLRVHLAVDHVEALLKLYGYQLDQQAKRTDPTAGQLRRDRIPDELKVLLAQERSMRRLPLPPKYMPPVDRWLHEAVAASPCLKGGGTPALGGHTMEHVFALTPGAEYEFSLLARRQLTASKSEVVTIARTTFRTSRYAGPRQLIEALGFTADGTGPLVHDAAVAAGATVPAAPSQVQSLLDDPIELEGARAALGLIPSAAVSLPRTTAIWKPNGASWDLHGVLLECDEPILRSGRVTRIRLAASRSGGTEISTERGFCDSTGSVVLLLFPMPIAAADRARLIVTTRAWPDAADVEIQGTALLSGAPLAVLREKF